MVASGKAPGYDNISMRIIKHSFHLISSPLTDIINLSLQKGTFPDKLKLTKVIPIYKANNPSLFTNYRPISLLSNFSKFFKKVMYNCITEFVEQYNILYRCQFGFRKNYLTSHALIQLINKVSLAIDQRKTTVGVFLDLSKAFDTLDHQIYLPSWNTMVSVMWLCSGLKATFLAVGNSSKLIKHVLQRKPLSVEFLKDPSLALYSSYYT